MRKLLSAVAFLFFFTSAFSQTPKWYLSVSTGAVWGGPKGAIKSKFENNGFNQTSTFNFFGWGGSTNYPIVSSGLPVLFKAGKKIKDNRSVYLMAGTSAAAEVSGFKNDGTNSGLFGSLGTHVHVRYKVLQVAVGMEYNLRKSRIKLGYAPGVFLLRYSHVPGMDKVKKETAVVPGLALTGRLPLGKEKRRIGMELVADINLAPPATIQEQYKTSIDGNFNSTEVQVLSPTKVSMVHGMAGLALTYRHK